MPANLTPQYFDAEERLRNARTSEEKLEILQEMLRIIPKHKGTDHLQGDIKRKISQLRRDAKKRPKGRRKPAYIVDREGSGQVAVIGGPNAGKSSLVAALTNATPPIAEYPFTTRMPGPGMMVHRQIQIQLVDTPPITAEVMDSWMPGLVQAADAALLVVDLAGEPLRSLEDVTARLGGSNVHLKEGKLGGDGMRRSDKPSIVVGNKIDLPDAADNLEVLQELYRGRFPIIPVSSTEKSNLEAVAADTFEILDLICVFTMEPGKKEPTGPPYALRRGSTILDLARAIHRDFPEKLRTARVWGSAKFDGQVVDRHFVLADKDTVELSVSA